MIPHHLSTRRCSRSSSIFPTLRRTEHRGSVNISPSGIRSGERGPRTGHHARAMTKEHTSSSAMSSSAMRRCSPFFTLRSTDLAPRAIRRQLRGRSIRVPDPRTSHPQSGSQQAVLSLQCAFRLDQRRVATKNSDEERYGPTMTDTTHLHLPNPIKGVRS